MKVQELTPEYSDELPQIKKEGVLYISHMYKVAIHLCACGCGKEAVCPLKHNEWTLTEQDGLCTLRPSIGNFNGENPYHAHYFITNNKIEWC